MFESLCIVGIRSMSMVFHIWVQLAYATICLPVNIFCRFLSWIMCLICLPARALIALQREKLVGRRLEALQMEVENLLRQNKELESHLLVAVKESHLLDSMLAELEEEHDKTIIKIELLENKVQNLKGENQQLREMEGKAYWDSMGNVGSGGAAGIPESYNEPSNTPSWKLSESGSGITLEDFSVQKGSDQEKDYSNRSGVSNPSQLVHLPTLSIMSRNMSMHTDELDVGQRRDIALFQSLFSASLSLVVGMIIWKAEDPCMPLVTALFIVVGMSLKSVVTFFSTIKNKPASDAVSLLSLNWFILGTLAYPSLPKVARALSPLVLSFVNGSRAYL